MPLDDTSPRPRVLVVDDEPSIRTVVRLMLARAGYVVEEASTAAEALRRAEETEHPFAVVLIDFTLPDRSGIEVLPDLRRLAPRTRMILTSGRSEDDFPSHGADGYLPKPFSRDQLVTAIGAVTVFTPQ